MIRYKEKEYYCSETGELVGTKRVVDKIICDYCGRICEEENVSEFTYTVEQSSSCEAYFDPHERMTEKWGDRDWYDLYNSSKGFTFCDGEDWDLSCSLKAILDNQNRNLAMSLTQSRENVIKKMDNIEMLFDE